MTKLLAGCAFAAVATSSAALAADAAAANVPTRPNILFILVDDLRPEFGAYGAKHIVAPNLDRLARQSVQFDRAYCMVPTCGASRASLWTGIRPSRNRFVNYTASAGRETPHAVTLNTTLQRAGYETISFGKVFHHREDNRAGWSREPWWPEPGDYQLPENQPPPDKGRFGSPVESADVPDDAYWDGQIATRAIAELRRLAQTPEQPFLLATGFVKPHLPFVAPRQYWELYDRANIRLPANYHQPQNAPPQAAFQSGELRSYVGIPPDGPVPDATALELIHGYYACVSYVDAQIGRVLDELDHLGLAHNTIVVLWGDHGWNLGDHGLWCKHCCFETAMRVPLLVRAPGFAGNGQRVRGLVESIDLYPTLCELVGVPAPLTVEGESFVSLLRDPSAAGKPAAIGRFQRGDTIRTDRYRFTEYMDDAGQPVARMLYDHERDPDETVNIAELPEMREIVADLAEQLRRGKGRDTLK